MGWENNAGLLGWEPVNAASDAGSAITLCQESTTDGLSVPVCKEGLGKVTVKAPSCSPCLCDFDLGQILVENLVAEATIEMWT